MITYRAFIEELRPILEEARKLRTAKKMHEDERFRKWRNKLEGLISQIVHVNYLLPCPVNTKARRFGRYGYTSTESQKEELFRKYQMEMDDTINELQLIIENYENHGEPAKGGKSATDLEMPKVVTASWLFHHAPISLWVKVITIAIAIFSFGVFIGQTDIYRKAAGLFAAKQEESTNGKK